MTLPEWAVYLGIGGGIITSVVALFKARPEARKLDAEGAAAITTSASTLVTSVRDEMAGLRAELQDMRRWRAGLEARLRHHARWDDQVVAVARSAGVQVVDPPPLYEDRE